jgi:beta-galactosidase
MSHITRGGLWLSRSAFRATATLVGIVCCLAGVPGKAAPADPHAGEIQGADSWGCRPASPAVVNPVVRSPLQSVLSLRGDWEFVTQGVGPLRHPGWRAFYAKPWPGARTLQVPGCWEEQGVGAPGMGDSWDCKWDHCAKPLRHVYSGDAWYRKTVPIPEAWRGQRVWLKIGGVRSQGWFWVNKTPVAWVDTYCGTFKYDVTDLVQPGQPAVVVAEVNSALPSRKGLFSSTHRFGGLYRDVELEATPDARIDYAYVRGDFDNKAAEVHATIAWSDPARLPKKPVLRVAVTTVDGRPAGGGAREVAVDPSRGTVEVVLPVALSPFLPWSPESPALYVAEITLCDGETPIHGWAERFGVRKLEARGERFYLNGKPFFVRGYGDDFVYPLSLVSPASREEHLRHFRAAREAGFVYVRLHTHCELPEYFEAADEAGVLVQPELPYYGDYPTEAFAFDPVRDLKELVTHYRRHVSLATYCMGNEGLLGKPLGIEIYKLLKRIDPDRLVLHQDGDYNTAENSDFRSGPINVWRPGSVRRDAPFIAHEYLNLSVKQDPRLAPRFSGVMMPPVPLETRDAWLAEAGLDRRWGDACQDASHALQRHYQKAGLEAARMDPACDGYDFWTIVDVIVQQGKTYSAQGFLNAFWEPKPGGFTPKEFRAFNDRTVLLLQAEPAARIAVSGERLVADFWISHYGEQPFKGVRLTWALRAGEAALARGECEGADVELGAVRSIGRADIAVPDVPKPVRAVLEASLDGGAVRNQWDFWLFPKRPPQPGDGIAVSKSLLPALAPLYAGLVAAGDAGSEKADLLISTLDSPDVAPALDDALAAGKRVILINRTTGKPNVSLGWWSMGNQVGTAFAAHPALGDFPHEGFLSPLAFRILKMGQKLPFLPGLRAEDMIVVGEGLDSYVLYAAQARAGQGLALMTFGLDLLSGLPEGTCILDGLIRYARSEGFNPQGRLELQPAAAKSGPEGPSHH